jgi:hypothetical protein
MAVGAIMIGIDILNPSTVVLISISETSTKTRGRNLVNRNKPVKGSDSI